jgi:uncharacterized protein
LNNLLKLQELDLKIERCRNRELEIPRQKEKFAIQKTRLAAELAASEKRCKDLLLDQRECEGEIEQKQAQIKKYETQLLAVKKNEEYQALLHEIDTLKKQIGLREERIIAILLESDEAQAHLAEDRTRIDAELRHIDEEYAKIDAELAEAVQDREALEKERVPLTPLIERGLLSRYTRIRKAKKFGPAVVPLRGECCTGCNMSVPPQVHNEILEGKIMHTCRHCGRLLYHGDNFMNGDAEILDNDA